MQKFETTKNIFLMFAKYVQKIKKLHCKANLCS